MKRIVNVFVILVLVSILVCVVVSRFPERWDIPVLTYLAICIPVLLFYCIFRDRGKLGTFAKVMVIAVFACLFAYEFFQVPHRLLFRLFAVVVFFALPICWFREWLSHAVFRGVLRLQGVDEEKLWHKCRRIREGYPLLKKHHKIIRSLARTEIASIDIAFQSRGNVRIQEPDLITTFKKYLAGTMVRLSLPDATSEYGAKLQQLRLDIRTEERAFSYVAVVHPKMADDIILMPPECSSYGGIRLAGLRRWLDEIVHRKA